VNIQVQNVTPDGCDCPWLPLECGMFSNSLLFPKAEKVLRHEGISVPRILKKGLCKKKKKTVMNNVYKRSFNKITWSATLIETVDRRLLQK
jgi:hypothetical protein